jgi:hypothetical protein
MPFQLDYFRFFFWTWDSGKTIESIFVHFSHFNCKIEFCINNTVSKCKLRTTWGLSILFSPFVEFMDSEILVFFLHSADCRELLDRCKKGRIGLLVISNWLLNELSFLYIFSVLGSNIKNSWYNVSFCWIDFIIDCFHWISYGCTCDFPMAKRGWWTYLFKISFLYSCPDDFQVCHTTG